MDSSSSSRVRSTPSDYANFSQLDGRHPWQERVPEGAVLYPVRRLNGGKVSYFNYDLAKEMGLIEKNHPQQLNKDLTDAILDTFCLRIINEYDQQNGIRYASHRIKPHAYMATRYLQLQHPDKAGRTSGDGRCIWNGCVVHEGRLWDVSSRGTGVTQLAPGAVKAGRPLRSGNHDHGYGCGMAEIDELYGSAILAEIFHRNGIPTERVLAIIDLGGGVGIGVRAAPNLIRPAHLFMYLKQGKRDPLRRAVDHLIDRQHANRVWNIKPDERNRDQKMLAELVRSFARFVATLDRDYIFAWLDWDGDNVLADAGIIDYGSVRQFGLRHDQYRYDDVERYSTNLNEQRLKAREIVQTFVQMVDFLEKGEKRPWREFANSTWLKSFDREFEDACLDRLLYQVGFVEPLRRVLLNHHRREVVAFFEAHSELERMKTHSKLKKVADGVHRPAIFNMRMALANMADYLNGLPMQLIETVSADEFMSWVLSGQARGKDRRLTDSRRRKFRQWQERYLKLMQRCCSEATWDKTLASVADRAMKINHGSRITGNAVIHIVDQILRLRRRGLSDVEVQKAIDELIQAQTLNPDFDAAPRLSRVDARVLRSFLTVVDGFKEDI